MALTATYLGKNPETGQPYFNYTEDDPTKALLITGPARGEVTLADGTSYSVDAEVVSIDADHVDEVHHHIEVQLEQMGVIEDFTHSPCDHCETTEA